MPRPPRLEFPDAAYHVTTRGNGPPRPELFKVVGRLAARFAEEERKVVNGGLTPVRPDPNPYAYCGNAPTDGTDATGMEDIKVSEIASKQPSLKNLSEQQRNEVMSKILDVKVTAFKLAASPVCGKQTSARINIDNYLKDWWLVGPGTSFPPENANPDGSFKIEYNCLGDVLMRFGQMQYNGKDVINLGAACWIGSPNAAIAPADLEKVLANEWDPVLKKLGKGFVRLDWKPDLSSPKAAENKPLAKCQDGKSYIILMAFTNTGTQSGFDENKPVTSVQISHIFSNYNQKTDLWISKMAAAGTIVTKSPSALIGQDGYPGSGGYGAIIGIWEEK